MCRPARPGFPVPMTYPDIRAVLGREQQQTLLADARMSGGAGSAVSWLSFPRIIDIPFNMCMAALEGWQRTGQGGELHIGQSLLRWPIEQDHDRCACRIGVGLARGPLRPPRRRAARPGLAGSSPAPGAVPAGTRGGWCRVMLAK